MNANYLSTLYKRKTNKNILDNIQSMRINEAKRLIKENGMSLEKIADAAGFGSFTTFNRVFKKVTGVAPSIYRDMNKK